MKLSIYVFLIALLIGCSTQEKKKEVDEAQPKQEEPPKESMEPKEEVVNIPEIVPLDVNYAKLDSTVRDNVKKLDQMFRTTPFYVRTNNRTYFITATKVLDYNLEWFNGTIKYGLADDSLNILLGQYYDKIYNPNLILENCFEIKQNDRVGLIDYESREVLNPQFNYILPSFRSPKKLAYGFKNNQWFEIRSSNIKEIRPVQFDPTPILKSLSFGIFSVGENMMFNSYYQYYENDANQGRGVVLVPSYVEYFNLTPAEAYTDVILPDERVEFGTKEARLKTSYKRSITDKLTSFFISVYEEAIDARGYQMEAKELVVHNLDNNSIRSVRLGSTSMYDYFCTESNYRFVNDSIVEVQSNWNRYNGKKPKFYDFETKYEYFKVTRTGGILKLDSDRHYDFTKYIYVSENQFKGCYAAFMKGDSYEHYNIWLYDHLSIEDLDIMRNEIFAEYGYKFKSAKWQEYFSKQPWYKPLYDDVNDRLSDIDKANVKTILEVKEKMIDNEDNYRNKRPSTFAPAG